MIHRIAFLTTLIALILIPFQAGSHHSFPAHYFQTTITKEGIIKEYLFRNPHAFVHMEVADENGEMATWAVELNNTMFLKRQGFGKDTLKAGDHIVVNGNPARDGANRMRMLKLTRSSDGMVMEIGDIFKIYTEPQSN